MTIISRRLDEASKKLEKVSDEVYQAAYQIMKSHDFSSCFSDENEHVIHTMLTLLFLVQVARRDSGTARKLAVVDTIITQTNETRLPHNVNPSAGRTFHCFPCLPAELRLMIWEEAAKPPPCVHFYESYKLEPRGRLPAAHLMEDGGLWTACQESRWAIKRVYEKNQMKEHKCKPITEPAEINYWSLRSYNADGVSLKKSIRDFYKVFEALYRNNFAVTGAWPRLVGELYDTKTYRKQLLMDERLDLASETICKELHWETMFEPEE